MAKPIEESYCGSPSSLPVLLTLYAAKVFETPIVFSSSNSS